MNNINVSFSTVSERDMDLLFANAFITYPGFIDLFLEETELKEKAVEISGVSLAKRRSGDSDITVMISAGGRKYCFLIKDEIDRHIRTDQHGRCVTHGEKHLAAEEYDQYEIFIICPQKHYETDEEAKKFEHFVSYERCREFFDSIDAADARIKSQMITQAINMVKPAPPADAGTKTFFRKYLDYQKLHFEDLSCSTDILSDDRIAYYDVSLKDACLRHDMTIGCVDLVFPTAGRNANLQQLCEFLEDQCGYNGILGDVSDDTAVLRKEVPALNLQQPFESIARRDIDKCFSSVRTLQEIAYLLENIRQLFTEER